MSIKQNQKEHLGALFLLFSVLLPTCCVESVCPNNCRCNWMEGTIAATCNGTDLPATVSRLPSETVQFVYIAQEYNIRLGEVSFQHLTRLTTLTISTTYDPNVLDKYLAPIPSSKQNIFAPLTELQTLAINVNWRFDQPLDDLFRPLVNLEVLDLSDTRKLDIHNLQQAMAGFQNQSKLRSLNLSNIQTYEFATHQTFNLSWFLAPLQNCPLRSLSLAYNAFKAIYPGIIRCTPHLEDLDASHNLLSPLLTSAFFLEAVLHTRLKTTDFSYQGFRYESSEHHGRLHELPHRFQSRRSVDMIPGTSEHVTPEITRLQLGRGLDLDVLRQRQENTCNVPGPLPIEWFHCIFAIQNDTCAILSPMCKPLKDFLEEQHECFCELLYTHAVDDYNVGLNGENFFRGIPCSAFPNIRDTVRQGCADCTVMPTAGSTTHLNLKNLNVYDEVFVKKKYRRDTKCFNRLNKLENLDLSDNFEHGYQDIDIFLGSNVSGLDRVKIFNLSNTGLTKVYTNIQKTFPQLQVLDMSRNQISLNRSEDFDLQRSRDEELDSTLEKFYLAYNRISTIPVNSFTSMPNLRTLDLGHNQIEDLDFDMSGLHSLTWLNLEYNMLSELPEKACRQLTELAGRTAGNITVDLSNNQISCSCANIPFLSFVHFDKPENLYFNKYSKYLCLDHTNNRAYLHVKAMNILALKIECLSNGALVGIGFACALVLVTIIVALKVAIYRKRWWFKYQYFLAHRLWQNYHQIATFETPFTYDLFVSYNQRDQQWIDDVLQPKLEDELDLNLCLHHRDFRLGEVITEQILESVETSRKTLFVLSKSFLASTWCHFEIQMAQHRLFSSGEDVILLALLEPLPNRMMSRTLKGLMETRTYVEWTEDDVYGQRLFWAKLEQAIQAPIQKPYDLEQQNPPLRLGAPLETEEGGREEEPLLARSGLTQSWHQVQANV